MAQTYALFDELGIVHVVMHRYCCSPLLPAGQGVPQNQLHCLHAPSCPGLDVVLDALSSTLAWYYASAEGMYYIVLVVEGCAWQPGSLGKREKAVERPVAVGHQRNLPVSVLGRRGPAGH